MITKAITVHSQFFSTIKTKKLIGNANKKAVKKESCRGEMFLVENINASYELRVLGFGLGVNSFGIYRYNKVFQI